MPVLNPQNDLSALQANLQMDNSWVVACYCAAWCNSCKKYLDDFTVLADTFPQHSFVWIDIEEHPELLGNQEVENFPTLLVQAGQKNVFFGPMLPHISHLQRLLLSLEDQQLRSVDGPAPLKTLLAPTT